MCPFLRYKESNGKHDTIVITSRLIVSSEAKAIGIRQGLIMKMWKAMDWEHNAQIEYGLLLKVPEGLGFETAQIIMLKTPKVELNS